MKHIRVLSLFVLGACTPHEPSDLHPEVAPAGRVPRHEAKADDEEERTLVERARRIRLSERADALAGSLGHGLLRETLLPNGSSEVRIWAFSKGEVYIQLERPEGKNVAGTLVVSRGQSGATQDCIDTYRYDRLQIIACVLKRRSIENVWQRLYSALDAEPLQKAEQTAFLGAGDSYTIYVERRTGAEYSIQAYYDGLDPRVRATHKSSGGDPVKWISDYFGADVGSSAVHDRE